MLDPASVQAQLPNVTGTWRDSGGSIWRLQASGPGLSALQASWQGSPGPHAGLRGNFNGTLTRQGGRYTYVGRMTLTEASVYVTGTMAFVILAAKSVSVSYQSSTGGRGNVNLARVVASPPVPQPPSPPRTPAPSSVDISNI